MLSEKNTLAWAIAVSTIPILEDLHGEHRCWKKGESPVPEYLYFDVLEPIYELILNMLQTT